MRNWIVSIRLAIGSSRKPIRGPDTAPGVARMPGFLSIYTGLRISDVCLLDTSKRLKVNDIFLRMHKTKRPLYTWIPDWLVVRLKAREKIHGPRIFLCGKTGNAKQLCDIWRKKRLKQVFKLAGPFEERATPQPVSTYLRTHPFGRWCGGGRCRGTDWRYDGYGAAIPRKVDHGSSREIDLNPTECIQRQAGAAPCEQPTRT